MVLTLVGACSLVACTSSWRSTVPGPFAATAEFDASAVPATASGDITQLVAAVVDYPDVVAPRQRFSFVVEIRNPLQSRVTLSPCPSFYATYGESGVVTTTSGLLPCRRIGTLESGERVRVRIPMRATEEPVTNEGGLLVTVDWYIGGPGGGRPAASFPLRMSSS
jgi:hypothetical protein